MNTYLQSSHRQKIIARIIVYPIFAILLCLTAVFTVAFLSGAPDLTMHKQTTYYSADGKKITHERHSQRKWVPLQNMSAYLIDATIAIEDKRFFEHKGFDVKRIMSAIYKDIKTRSLKEGASTLTQQYARSLYLSTEKTLTRKLKEAFYTIRLEMFYSKKEILEGYLNTVYYGYGAYGADEASEVYFAKPAKDLSLAEAAMIAGIPKGPTYYSPFNDEARAKNRQQLILRQMHAENMIGDKAYAMAANAPLQYANKESQNQTTNVSYFTDTVLHEAATILNLDRQAVKNGGFKIYTTLDQAEQKDLEAAVSKTIPGTSDIEIAAIAMDPKTGAIHALTGGKDHGESQFNRAIAAKRMPGSAFKPFLYYAALNRGYSPTTMLTSKPTAFQLADGKTYEPGNYNGYYANKPITLAQALALSDNIYAVKTNLYLGVDTLPKTAKKFGFTSHMPAVASLALGTAAVSLKEMVTGYGMLANGGKEVTAHTITKIIDPYGKTVYEQDFPTGKAVLNPKKTFILTELLTGMFDTSLNGYMSVTGATIADRLTRPYAGKSGTTDSDSWMIGYSPDLVTGVWTGYDDNRAMNKVVEHAYAKDVWADFMEEAHRGMPVHDFQAPKAWSLFPSIRKREKELLPFVQKVASCILKKAMNLTTFATSTMTKQNRYRKRNRKKDCLNVGLIYCSDNICASH
ncbi:transglycosylase domain-containing protein [Virgibacillus sp. 179-BFC.A HS]|uniref:Transglycosylase domain-containing protein n=1 Tax=Tigheibacillus jepli TaxID=3035914 RepID=A0ABU5CG20_9BACI|nr:transglycosylase domain-containing protein [Virgibacillus sp. 179-BFC.A HS]MDY0404528.1 transglycosylase domain-containing protein [Virgibacillus sp. 179-BFC.A HS]